MYKTKNTGKDIDLNVTKNGLVDLDNKIKDMSKNETENERLYGTANTVKDILYVNNQSHERQELKILTPEQMLTRLPISLAQLKSENNSEKLKN